MYVQCSCSHEVTVSEHRVVVGDGIKDFCEEEVMIEGAISSNFTPVSHCLLSVIILPKVMVQKGL